MIRERQGTSGSRMAQDGFRFRNPAAALRADRRRPADVVLMILVLLGFLLTCALSSSAAEIVNNGAMTVRVHTPDDLSSRIVERDGRRVLRSPDGSEVELMAGPDDPRLLRRAGSFTALPVDVVGDAIRAIHTVAPRLVCDVLLLPAPPVAEGGSFARGNVVYLSPSFGTAPATSVAELITHELGHVLTWAYFDCRTDLWREYFRLRGLSDAANGSAAVHAWRAREILAEDLRHLFGGELAVACGVIENQMIPLPEEVAGLEIFLRDAVSGSPGVSAPLLCRAHPNPCNPRTTITMSLASVPVGADPAAARLAVFDLRGRMIKRVDGGSAADGILSLTWDGRDSGGREAPSGRYLYRVEWAGARGAGAVMLVR